MHRKSNEAAKSLLEESGDTSVACTSSKTIMCSDPDGSEIKQSIDPDIEKTTQLPGTIVEVEEKFSPNGKLGADFLLHATSATIHEKANIKDSELNLVDDEGESDGDEGDTSEDDDVSDGGPPSSHTKLLTQEQRQQRTTPDDFRYRDSFSVL